MLSPPETPTRLPGYDLREPEEADVHAALQRVFGSTRGTERWEQACRECGLTPGHVATRAFLDRALAALATQGGPAAVVARSMEIRQRTFARLTAVAARQAR